MSSWKQIAAALAGLAMIGCEPAGPPPKPKSDAAEKKEELKDAVPPTKIESPEVKKDEPAKVDEKKEAPKEASEKKADPAPTKEPDKKIDEKKAEPKKAAETKDSPKKDEEKKEAPKSE